METIVVGVDGSECSRAALRFALEEASLRRARLRVVHAWTAPSVSTYHEADRLIRSGLDRLQEEAQALVDAAVRDVVGDSPAVAVETVVLEGAPAPALVQAASDAALLVVGSRGLGGFRALLLGSVGSQCAQYAPCAVAIVRAGLESAR
jgi:nucleotide-binding universal stress UspA family protein